MRVVVFRSNCPTNRGSCPIGVIVLRGRCPKSVVVLMGNWQRGSCPTGVIFLWGSCHWGSCPQGSCSRIVIFMCTVIAQEYVKCPVR